MRESGLFVSSVIVLGACSVAFAGPVTMDFEHLASINNTSQGNTVVEDGFQVSNSHSKALVTFGTNHPWYAGSTGLWDGWGGKTLTLSQVGGGSFSIQSIDLAQWSTNNGRALPLTFTGTFSGGGTISMGVSLPASGSSLSFTTYGFSAAWTGLTQVTWINPSPYHQFDNINVTGESVIPLPGGAAMAMVGMGVIGVRRRRG